MFRLCERNFQRMNFVVSEYDIPIWKSADEICVTVFTAAVAVLCTSFDIWETEACDTVRCFIKLRITNKDIVEVGIRVRIQVYNILFDPKTTISTSLPSVIIHTSDSPRRHCIST